MFSKKKVIVIQGFFHDCTFTVSKEINKVSFLWYRSAITIFQYQTQQLSIVRPEKHALLIKPMKKPALPEDPVALCEWTHREIRPPLRRLHSASPTPFFTDVRRDTAFYLFKFNNNVRLRPVLERNNNNIKLSGSNILLLFIYHGKSRCELIKAGWRKLMLVGMAWQFVL